MMRAFAQLSHQLSEAAGPDAARRLTGIIGIALALALLLGGCGEPAVTPSSEAVPVDAAQEYIRRVENGLIPVTAEGGFDLEDPRTLAERMDHYGVPGVSIAVIDDHQLAWAKGYGVLEAAGG